MPLYEYKCEKCGNQFEVIQKFADQPLTVHEDCGGGVHRLLSAPALQFKGSGFYITDYAKGSGSGSQNSKDQNGKSGKETSGDKGKGDSGSSTSNSPSKTDSSPASPAPASSTSGTK